MDIDDYDSDDDKYGDGSGLAAEASAFMERLQRGDVDDDTFKRLCQKFVMISHTVQKLGSIMKNLTAMERTMIRNAKDAIARLLMDGIVSGASSMVFRVFTPEECAMWTVKPFLVRQRVPVTQTMSPENLLKSFSEMDFDQCMAAVPSIHQQFPELPMQYCIAKYGFDRVSLSTIDSTVKFTLSETIPSIPGLAASGVYDIPESIRESVRKTCKFLEHHERTAKSRSDGIRTKISGYRAQLKSLEPILAGYLKNHGNHGRSDVFHIGEESFFLQSIHSAERPKINEKMMMNTVLPDAVTTFLSGSEITDPREMFDHFKANAGELARQIGFAQMRVPVLEKLSVVVVQRPTDAEYWDRWCQDTLEKLDA